MTYNIYLKNEPEPYISQDIHYDTIEFGSTAEKVVMATYKKGILTIPYNNVSHIQEVEE